MNAELENVSTRFKLNKLSLNVDKIKSLLFRPFSKRQLFTKTKSLGAFINENLSWKQRINKVRSKIFKSIGILHKSRDVLSKQCIRQQYFFVYS